MNLPRARAELLALQAVQLWRMQKPRGQRLHHALDSNLNRLPARVQDKVGLRRWLVGRVNTREPFDLTRVRTRVEALGVALFIWLWIRLLLDHNREHTMRQM